MKRRWISAAVRSFDQQLIILFVVGTVGGPALSGCDVRIVDHHQNAVRRDADVAFERRHQIVEGNLHMIELLMKVTGRDKDSSYALVNLVGDLRINQIVDPTKGARMEVPNWVFGV